MFDATYTANYNDDEIDYLESNPSFMGKVKNYYLQNGVMPKLNHSGGTWFTSGDYSIDENTTQPHQQPQQQQGVVDRNSPTYDDFKRWLIEQDRKIRNKNTTY